MIQESTQCKVIFRSRKSCAVLLIECPSLKVPVESKCDASVSVHYFGDDVVSTQLSYSVEDMTAKVADGCISHPRCLHNQQRFQYLKRGLC